MDGLRPSRDLLDRARLERANHDGRRLKITVSGGDFPHSLPPLPQFAGSLAGRVQVLTDPEHPSYVELPALRRHCPGDCPSLPVPDLVRGD